MTIASALQEVAPGAIIELFQLTLNAAQHGVSETHYFHAGTNATGGNIVWAGQAYQAWPIKATEFEYSGTGSLPRPKLEVANIYGTITAIVLSLPDGLEGAKVTRVRTLARFIDAVNFQGGINPHGTPQPTEEFPREIYYIDRKVAENRGIIEFELAAAFDLAGVRLPKRQCVNNVCQWGYRSSECGYTGAAYFNFNDEPVASAGLDVCGKRLASCEARFSQVRHPGVVTIGSNVITLDQVASLSIGEPVSGYGIPAGATVTGVSGRSVTISQNATASTYAVSNGTISADGTQITLASAAGITAGVTVTGAYLPGGSTQVVAVTGNVVTLSSPVPLEQFFTAITSATATPTESRDAVMFPEASTAAVGQYIASSTLPLSQRARIINVRYAWVQFFKEVVKYKILDIDKAVASNESVLWTTYTGGTIPAASYSFESTTRQYTFRADTTISYGSFPGIGTFFT